MKTVHKTTQRSLYEELAGISKALASPARLEIIDQLSQKDRSVEGLAQEIAIPVANVSQHLQKLKQARLVESRKEGTRSIYRLADPKVLALWREMRELAFSRNAEIRRLMNELHQSDEKMGYNAQELLRKVENEEIVLVDVRPEDEFQAGHIAEALSVPYDRIEQELDRIPATRTIVAYCRGPFCVMSDQAVELLRKKGYHATSFREGFSGWMEQGLPIEKK